MGNDLVRYSRAGDAFHHYWAARRCLRMIYPKSLLRKIVIEGSGTKEQELAGEYAIDVSEYSDTEKDNVQKIEYIQLKHTTVQMEKPFKLSELKSTIVAFAKRYSEHFRIEKETTISSEIIFSIITNRPIDEPFKTNIIKIGQGDEVDPRFRMVLEKYTQLKQNDLQKFCLSVKFFDGEGDYNAQRYELHAEIAQLLAGTVDNSQIEYIKSLIHDKALPGSNGEIVREEVLKYFGVTSERDLYPAPPELEILDNVIPRIQHNELLNNILQASAPIIIHAIGGVGKSVFARQIAKSIPINSFTVLYDCFGGGRYRNRSELRHRHRDALVQIANELASHGLCDPLIALSTALDDQILREFLSRIRKSVYALKKTDQNARLVLIIDAADNAEMAAKEYQNDCFVTDLLKESLSEGCQLVLLCRTERIFLLDPSNKILQLELMPFSVGETSHHLKTFFPDATDKDGLEFHRLTNNGNPRVQANSLSLRFNSIIELLTSLGPSGTSV